MAYYKIKKDTKGELYADIRISYKNSITGKYKIASKRFRNVDNLTEAKFKKYIEKEAFRYEEEANITFEEQNDKDRILTFKEFANEWLKTLEKTLSYNYYRRAVYTIDKFNDFLEKENLDKKPISEIKVRDVQLFLNQSLEERELAKPQYKLKIETEYEIPIRVQAKDNNWNEWEAKQFCKRHNLKFEKAFEISRKTFQYSLSTLKGFRRIIRTVFNEAVRYEWITRNPVCYTKVTSSGNNGTLRAITEKEVFSQKEINEFIRALDKIKDLWIYKIIPLKIMLFTGLRNGEVHGLKWDDIDFEKKVIHVTKSRYYAEKRGVFEKEPKTKSSIRDVPMPDYLIQELEEYKDWFRVYDKDFDKKPNKYYICSNLYREPVDPKCLAKWLREFEVKNNLKHVTCHGLRHTYCSLLLSQNVPIQTVSKYMGHSDSAVTLKVYSHFMPETQILAVNALNNILEEK